MRRTQNGYYTLPCADGCWRGWYTYGSIRRFWLMHNWWKHGDAFKPRRCVPCKGTGRVIVTLARPSWYVDQCQASVEDYIAAIWSCPCGAGTDNPDVTCAWADEQESQA